MEPDAQNSDNKKIIQQQVGRDIQPLNKIESPQSAPVQPRVNVAEIYPDASQNITPDSIDYSPNQKFAMSISKAQSEEANKPVSSRIKTLKVIAIIGLVGTLISFVSLMRTKITSDTANVTVTIEKVVDFIAFAIYGYLIIAKDQYTVALILRVLLVFSLLSVISSGIFVNPPALFVNGIELILLIYVYMRVSSLKDFH